MLTRRSRLVEVSLRSSRRSIDDSIVGPREIEGSPCATRTGAGACSPDSIARQLRPQHAEPARFRLLCSSQQPIVDNWAPLFEALRVAYRSPCSSVVAASIAWFSPVMVRAREQAEL